MSSISVVCPTYNSATYVERTLKTVVDQTRLPDELIISDDGSTDGTLEVVERFLYENAKNIEWKLVRNTHRGPGATRNAGINAAQGDWVAFLDSDDIWEPEKLEQVEAAIIDNPKSNLFCHDEHRIDKNGRMTLLEYGRRYRQHRPLLPQIYLANMFSTSAVTCRRQLIIDHGGFDETLMSAQDYELWLRLSPHMKPTFIRIILGKYMERPGNITSSNLHKRMRNEFRIAWMHRDMVPFYYVIARILRIGLSYSRQYVSAFRSL